MTIEKRVVPYELLTRFGEDGSWQGAHVIEATRYVEADGPASMPTYSAARPLTQGEFRDLLGEHVGAMIVAADQAIARADAAESQLAIAEAAGRAMADRIAELEAQLAAVRAAIGGGQ